MRYLDPKNDFTFINLFGSHPHLLKSFLNAMLPFEEGGEIDGLEYLPAEMIPPIPLILNSVVGAKCKDKSGRQFIVVMEMAWTPNFTRFGHFCGGGAILEQLGKRQDYLYSQTVYALSLIDDTYESGAEFYHHYTNVYARDPERQIKGLEFVFIELPKFKPDNLSQKKLQVLWLRFLTEIGEKSVEIPTELMNQSEIREAIGCLEESAYTNRELDFYDRCWDRISTERTLFYDVMLKVVNKGMEKGYLPNQIRKK